MYRVNLNQRKLQFQRELQCQKEFQLLIWLHHLHQRGIQAKISDDFINLFTSNLRRNSRNHNPENLPKHCFLSEFNNVKSRISNMTYDLKNNLSSSMEDLNSYYGGTVNELQNHAYVPNKIVCNDMFTFAQVKQHPEGASFLESMIAETNNHEERSLKMCI